MFTFTINTRYNQPTESRGSSITAYLTSGCINKSFTIAYDYALNAEDNHNKAANLLAIKLFPDYDSCLPYKETSSKKGYKYSGYIGL